MNTTENLISIGCPATAPQLTKQIVKPTKFPAQPQEWKIVSLRECPTPDTMQRCETPDQAAAYWKSHIATHPYFNSECECLVVFILNTRRRVKGHYLVSIGTMDTILCRPREVFRLAIMASAAAIIIAHNHPSGESTPSEADIKITRDLIRAGQLLKIEVLDHIVMGNPNHKSLRSLGYFTAQYICRVREVILQRAEESPLFFVRVTRNYRRLPREPVGAFQIGKVRQAPFQILNCGMRKILA